MDYIKLVEKAQKGGNWNEKTMISSVDSISGMLDELKKVCPDKYWCFMREQHGIMFNNHYCEEFAMYDVAQMRYTNRDGRKCEGAYWTCEQIEDATKGMAFPAGTTKWDKFVAFNGFYADLCRIYTDEEIIKGAFAFYFADEDAPQGKIWLYMAAMKSKKDSI